jgi:hypothetical protein
MPPIVARLMRFTLSSCSSLLRMAACCSVEMCRPVRSVVKNFSRSCFVTWRAPHQRRIWASGVAPTAAAAQQRAGTRHHGHLPVRDGHRLVDVVIRFSLHFAQLVRHRGARRAAEPMRARRGGGRAATARARRRAGEEGRGALRVNVDNFFSCAHGCAHARALGGRWCNNPAASGRVQAPASRVLPYEHGVQAHAACPDARRARSVRDPSAAAGAAACRGHREARARRRTRGDAGGKNQG